MEDCLRFSRVDRVHSELVHGIIPRINTPQIPYTTNLAIWQRCNDRDLEGPDRDEVAEIGRQRNRNTPHPSRPPVIRHPLPVYGIRATHCHSAVRIRAIASSLRTTGHLPGISYETSPSPLAFSHPVHVTTSL